MPAAQPARRWDQPDRGLQPPIGFTPGNIAMIDRGNCEFGEKAVFAETAGASAAVIVNNDPGQSVFDFQMGPGVFGAAVTIPTIMIGFDDGNEIRAVMDVRTVHGSVGHHHPASAWEIAMRSVVFDQLNDPNPDNDIDNSSVLVMTHHLFFDGFESGFTNAWAREQ